MDELLQGLTLDVFRSYSHPLISVPIAKLPSEIVGVDGVIR
jgi:hypothetical protein